VVINKLKYPPNTVNEHLEGNRSMQTKEEPRRTGARTNASGRSRNRRRNQPAWILLFLPSLKERRCHGVSLGLPSISCRMLWCYRQGAVLKLCLKMKVTNSHHMFTALRFLATRTALGFSFMQELGFLD
jgi:hypothetical protein